MVLTRQHHMKEPAMAKSSTLTAAEMRKRIDQTIACEQAAPQTLMAAD